jgi:hypothetical protein
MLVTTFCWASNIVAGKEALTGFNSLALAQLRMGAAAILYVLLYIAWRASYLAADEASMADRDDHGSNRHYLKSDLFYRRSGADLRDTYKAYSGHWANNGVSAFHVDEDSSAHVAESSRYDAFVCGSRPVTD